MTSLVTSSASSLLIILLGNANQWHIYNILVGKGTEMKLHTLFLAMIALGLGNSALASYDQAPPSFTYKQDQAVFIDFDDASYDISYDFSNKKVSVNTLISFTASKAGYPIFDLVASPSEVILDGQNTYTETIKDPDQQTTLRIIQQTIAPGRHQLQLKHFITTNVVFGAAGLASGFWTSDLNDRRYLEQYLPTNLEFDQYKMYVRVNVLGAEGLPHVLKTNGNVTQIAENSFEVVFPKFYTASSVFFHLFPAKNSGNNVQFYYPSIDGRLIPVDIYTTYNTEEFVVSTKKILAELEADYGPFPHDQVIIYGNSPSGGMEYSGATATSLSALGHELFHSYHARALMPANGNAGWMDEAIARWRDNKYPFLAKLNFESTQLAGHSVWSRMTDRMAYTEGSAFLSLIAYRMNEKGLSLKLFFKDYFQTYKYTTVTTPLFQAEITRASSLDLAKDFDKYIYGKSYLKNSARHTQEDPNHPRLTKEQLLELTWP